VLIFSRIAAPVKAAAVGHDLLEHLLGVLQTLLVVLAHQQQLLGEVSSPELPEHHPGELYHGVALQLRENPLGEELVGKLLGRLPGPAHLLWGHLKTGC